MRVYFFEMAPRTLRFFFWSLFKVPKSVYFFVFARKQKKAFRARFDYRTCGNIPSFCGNVIFLCDFLSKDVFRPPLFCHISNFNQLCDIYCTFGAFEFLGIVPELLQSTLLYLLYFCGVWISWNRSRVAEWNIFEEACITILLKSRAVLLEITSRYINALSVEFQTCLFYC